MIPIKLTIEGLYSYQERQEIDFNKLTDSHIFGIFGSVGSGKSSILEAITFALYGKTDRLNLSGDNRNYNMMNLKSDSLFIEFVFMVGSQSYMIRVKGRRNSKRFEDVKALDRQAYKEIEGQWVPIELEEIENAVGLSYENFKRTIIIPQGKFKEFLELGNKDRTQMMKELFNLNKFELYYKVAAIEAKNNKGIENINGQLQQLGDVNPEQLIEAEKILEGIKNQLKKFNKLRDDIRDKEKVLAELKELTEKLKKAADSLAELKAKSGQFTELEKKIENYEYCLVHFKSLLENIDISEKKIQTLNLDVNSGKKAIYEFFMQEKKLEKELKNIKPAYEKREELKVKADELSKVLELINLKKENSILKERLEKGRSYISDMDKNIGKIKDSRIKIEEIIEKQKKELPDILEFSKAKEWFIMSNNLQKRHNENQKKLEEVVSVLTEIHRTFFKILQNDILKGRIEVSDDDYDVCDEPPYEFKIAKKFFSVAEDSPFFENLINNKTEEINVLEKQITQCNVQKQLGEYAGQLENGKSCPLCGALEHPAIFEIEEINGEITALDKKKNLLTSDIESIKELIKEIEIEKNNHNNINRTHSQLVKENIAILRDIEVHELSFDWEPYKSLDTIEKNIEKYKSLKKKLDNEEENLYRANKNIEKEKETIERYRQELEKILSKNVENETKIETLNSQIKLLSVDDYLTIESDTIREEIKYCKSKYSQLEEKFNTISQNITTLQNKQGELKGRLDVNVNALEVEKTSLLGYKQKQKEQLKLSSYKDIEEVHGILKYTFDLEKSKKSIKEYKENLYSIERSYNELEKQINGRVYNPEQHYSLIEELKTIELDIERNNRELGSTETLINKIKKELEQKKDLLDKLDKLSLRAEDIKTMKQLFKASGFVNYVSSVHLQNLCKLANERFHKLTRQKLRLEITEDNNFQVRDFMNGGKLRNVKTLSGGQTFQASLSLALALADSIQKFTNSSQNFFFLDEGFGSLDKDALGIVFDTLKSLRKEDRIIGVISHVEDMQQEIEVFVKVKNIPDTGSILEFSWN